MNHFTGYELLWLFFVYSFVGWVLETVFAAMRQKKFVNRGLVNGPFCVLYGITSVIMTVGLQELDGVWLFLFAAVYGTVAEWVSGHLIEKVFKERWWDYSGMKWNLDGYICISASVFWGALGFVVVRWGNGLTLLLLSVLPAFFMQILLLVLVGILALDIFASAMLLWGKSRNPKRWESADAEMDKVRERLEAKIAGMVQKRIRKAYPKAKKAETGFTAHGGLYKLVLLFFIGAFLGDITETIFCRITMGVWMSRSSVVWGPFSIVWGLAIALVTLLLYKYKDRSDSFLFLVGTLLGGAYEYLCSVFTEIVFGKVFWDYSGIPFNLGGRINLLYCFFWGIAAVVWFKKLFPPIDRGMRKLPVLAAKVAAGSLLVFMICNVVVSCGALIRYDERGQGIAAETSWQEWMDVHYDDAKMEQIYPNAKAVE